MACLNLDFYTSHWKIQVEFLLVSGYMILGAMGFEGGLFTVDTTLSSERSSFLSLTFYMAEVVF